MVHYIMVNWTFKLWSNASKVSFQQFWCFLIDKTRQFWCFGGGAVVVVLCWWCCGGGAVIAPSGGQIWNYATVAPPGGQIWNYAIMAALKNFQKKEEKFQNKIWIKKQKNWVTFLPGPEGPYRCSRRLQPSAGWLFLVLSKIQKLMYM